jgi:hypothetical protein
MATFDELEIEMLHTFCVSAQLLNSTAALSRRQSASVALILNRFDWLWNQDLTMLDAIKLIGPRGLSLVTEVDRRYFSGSELDAGKLPES